jgi:serine/threonine protein kinase
MTNLMGHTLGRYQILEQVGEGGMATVYKAYDTRLGRYVALKVMRPAAVPDPSLLRRFEFEAMALAKLAHPAIVRVLDYGEENNLPYLVLEYIPDGTLKDVLASGPRGTSRPLPWRQAAQLLAPIARALEYAHQHSIIHRDVKPSNILMTASGQPMLSDFGIAKTFETEATAQLTGTGVRLGTPEYMSPEQCQGKPVDTRTDIYSLGIVFYELITGHKPFTADSQMVVMHSQIYDPLPSPRRYLAHLPKNVERVLNRALAKNPQARFQNMASYAAALEGLAHEPKSLFSLEGLSDRIRPSWLWLGGIAAGGIGLLVLLSFLSLARPFSNLFPVADGTKRPTPAPTSSQPAAAGWKQGRLAYSQKQGSANALWMMNLQTDAQPHLLFGAEGSYALGADWAPDGKHLAFYNYPDTLQTIDTTTEAAPQTVGRCGSPSWSPDGKQILCVSSKNGHFQIINLNGRPDSPVPNAVGSIPVWSPTHNEIAYSTQNKQKGSSIWRSSLDTHQSLALVEGAVENFAPSWSADGNQIAYQSNAGSDQSEIWVMGRGGENPHRLTTTPNGGWSRGPTWSPDGQWLAFVSNRGESAGSDYGEIYVVSIKTGETIQVTHTGGQVYDWRVSWAQ